MFDKIKKDSPKAWAKFIVHSYSLMWGKYILENKFIRLNKTSEFEEYILSLPLASLIGHLEDFFDSVGIYFHTYPVDYNNTKRFQTVVDGERISLVSFKSRDEARQVAVPKAFEILEKSL